MSTKRARPALTVYHSKRENDLVVNFDRSQSDGRWFMNLLGLLATGSGPSQFTDKLRERGFDPETFRCSVRRLKGEPAAPGASGGVSA